MDYKKLEKKFSEYNLKIKKTHTKVVDNFNINVFKLEFSKNWWNGCEIFGYNESIDLETYVEVKVTENIYYKIKKELEEIENEYFNK
jgi:hypothetical protein